MRNLLALVAAALVTAGIAGSYLGWYKVTTAPGPNGHRNVSIDLNTPKIQQDVAKEAKTIEHVIDKKLSGKSTSATQPVTPLSVASGATDGNASESDPLALPITPVTPVTPTYNPYQALVPITTTTPTPTPTAPKVTPVNPN